MRLLRMDTAAKFVQLIKIVQQKTGMGHVLVAADVRRRIYRGVVKGPPPYVGGYGKIYET
jgi:hypothetical protein